MKFIFAIMMTVILLCPAYIAMAWDVQNLVEEENLPSETRTVLGNSAFVQAIEELPYLFILTEDAKGYRQLFVFQQSESGFLSQALSAPLPAMHGIKPTIIATTNRVSILYSEALLYTFRPDHNEVWRLGNVQGENDYRCTRFWLIEWGLERSRLIYGANTSAELALFDPADFPPDFGSAAQRLDTSGFALVNNPDPANRLNLRAEPSQTSDSKGKYYNGTPVLIMKDLGDWVWVSVAETKGYMMKQYLAFGMDMLNVQTAFPELFIKQSLAGVDVNVYLQPDHNSGIAGVLTDYGTGREEITIIGVIGDDWVHVICGNGLTGYMPAWDFYPGNG